MSIRSSLQSHAGSAGLLTHLQPLLGGPVVRELYVYRDVMQAISGPWRDDDDRVACSFLRRELDRFVEGQVVSLALQPFRKRADAAVAILVSAARASVRFPCSRTISWHPSVRVLCRQGFVCGHQLGTQRSASISHSAERRCRRMEDGASDLFDQVEASGVAL